MTAFEEYRNKLVQLIDDRASIIWVTTYDFEYIRRIFNELTSPNGFKTIFSGNIKINANAIAEWSVATGLVRFNPSIKEDNRSGTLFQSLQTFCGNPEERDEDGVINRQILILQDVADLLKSGSADALEVKSKLQSFAYWNNQSVNRKQSIVIISPDSWKIPGLENIIEYVDEPYPNEKDIRRELGVDELEQYVRQCKNNGESPSVFQHGDYVYSKAFLKNYRPTNGKKLVESLSGMRLYDIRNVMYYVMQHGYPLRGQIYSQVKLASEISLELSELIKSEKKRLVLNSGLLEVISVDEDQRNRVGNIDNLRCCLATYKNIIDNIEYYPQGMPKPKGILMVGAPGCGKSETAKTVSAILNVPLLRLDIGTLMGKYVGESEHNLIEAIRIAESAAPCVLWLDEIEKAFAGFGGDDGNDITVTRMVGYFLTWMQERKSLVFLVATANNLDNLRPEFLRKGRWNKIFYLNYPDKKGVRDILHCCMRKYHLSFSDNNDKDVAHTYTNDVVKLDCLIDKIYSEEMSGADIESLIIEAFNKDFVPGKEKKISIDSLFEVIDMSKIKEKREKEEKDNVRNAVRNHLISIGRFDLLEFLNEDKLGESDVAARLSERLMRNIQTSQGRVWQSRKELETQLLLDYRMSHIVGVEYCNDDEKERKVKGLIRQKIDAEMQQRNKLIAQLNMQMEDLISEYREIYRMIEERMRRKNRDELEKHYRMKGYESASNM